MISLFALLYLLPLVSTLPIEHRSANTVCGQFDTISSGSYSLHNNLWGHSSATSGHQCSTLEFVQGDTVKWTTNWTWEGKTGIKSFSNVQLNEGVDQQLSAINNIPSMWHWSQSGTGHVVSDVAFDMFTSYSPGGDNVNEVMVWLQNTNAGPISFKYDENGQALPIATSIIIGDYTWDLHAGSNGYNPVYSFLPADAESITAFNGDIYLFFQYLFDGGHVSPTEYLKTAQAGMEATCGNATLETSAYKLSIN